MARTVVSNIAKGREFEFLLRVMNNDPANSALVMLVLAAGGDSLETLQDYDTVAAVLAGPSNEVTNSGYSRKIATDAASHGYFVDDTGNGVYLGFPAQTFTSIGAGDVWDIVVVAYDNDTTSGTDANLIPITFSEARIDNTAVMANGNNITAYFPNSWISHS